MYGTCPVKRIVVAKNPVPSIPIPKIGFGYDYFSNGSCPKPEVRPKYRNNVDRPRGAHDFYNVMWDPHVYRGKTFKPFQEVERCRAKALQEAKSRPIRHRRRKILFSPIEIPKTPPPPPVYKYVVNMDQFLIEKVPRATCCDNVQQTDDISRKKDPKSSVVPKLGFDTGTSIEPGEIFTFEEVADPVATTMGKKVLEQALRESMEEEELMAIREEQNEYEERRRLEALRLKRIEGRCQEYMKQSARVMKRREAKRQKELSAERRVGARMFSQSYLKLLMPQLLRELKGEGFFEYVDERCLTRNFTPWINQAVEAELCQQLLVGEFFDSLLHELCFNRKTEYRIGRFRDTGDTAQISETIQDQ